MNIRCIVQSAHAAGRERTQITLVTVQDEPVEGEEPIAARGAEHIANFTLPSTEAPRVNTIVLLTLEPETVVPR